MSKYTIHKFPNSRIATIDVCEIGQNKHHIVALLEIDVTLSRDKVKKYKRDVGTISYTAWLIKVICHTINDHKNVAAYLKGKNKIIMFNDITVSLLVEKEYNGEKVPIPLIIKKAHERSIESITHQLNDAKKELLTENDIVLQSSSTGTERFYYKLPGFIRRTIWKLLLKHPDSVFDKMGNVAITSIGMMGKVNGWFIPISIHPICFGIGSIIKKPVVIDNAIEIREIMNMTVLIDHDVIDGAPMARFISELSKNIEKGIFL